MKLNDNDALVFTAIKLSLIVIPDGSRLSGRSSGISLITRLIDKFLIVRRFLHSQE